MIDHLDDVIGHDNLLRPVLLVAFLGQFTGDIDTNALACDLDVPLGIEVVDVRVKRIDLPKEVSDSVFNRMEAEREKKAREYRAKGGEQAERIRAEADRQRVIIEAQAYRDGEMLRGEGDAQAAAIYADAYSQDPEFFAFTRSLEAYRSSFAGKQDMIVVKPDGEFFRYLNQSSDESEGEGQAAAPRVEEQSSGEFVLEELD